VGTFTSPGRVHFSPGCAGSSPAPLVILARTMAPPKKTAKPKAKTLSTRKSAADEKPTGHSPLHKLVARVGPARPVVVRLATRGISRASLNELGAGWSTRTILDAIAPFVSAQLLAWKKLSPEERAHFVGWSESLVAQIVLEGVKLAEMLQAFESAAREDTGEKKVDAARYKDLRAAAIQRRDRVARALRTLVDPGSDAALKLATTKQRSDTPAALAASLRSVALVAKELIGKSDDEERAALAEANIDEALVASLEAQADHVEAIGEQRKKGAAATRVAQEQLDEQDGIVLRLIQVAWRRWRDGREMVPSVPSVDLGPLRGLVKTGVAGDEPEAPPAS
jgi:hypothetical protein